MTTQVLLVQGAGEGAYAEPGWPRPASRAMAIGLDGSIVASAQEEFPQIFPQSGWVEHDPEAIWRTQRRTAEQTLERLLTPQEPVN